MREVRLISKLEIKSDNVVKPIYFEGLKYIGDPKLLAKKFYDNSIDELILIDIVASLYRRKINLNLIKEVSQNVFIPLTAGGFITSLSDISKILQSGADKVCINTHSLQYDPKLINRAAKKFGSQCIIANLEIKKIDKQWICLSDGGRISSRREVKNWIKELQERGIGEILLQSVDRDGSKKGFDIELFDYLNDSFKVPIIHCSGAGSLEDFKKLKKRINPQSVAFSTVLYEEICSINKIRKIFSI